MHSATTSTSNHPQVPNVPVTDHLRPKPGRSLAEVRPDLADQWHPVLNGELRPENVSASTNRKLWWKCPEGPDHEWQAPGCNRVAGRGCPFCRGFAASVTNNVASVPMLAAQWHPFRNGQLRPEEVVARTTKKLWWRCPEGPDHEWQARGSNRVNGAGCPFCAGQRASQTNSLARYRELAVQWHPSRNGELMPRDVVAGSHKKVWWKCPNGPDHEWQAAPQNRMKATGCPFCRGLYPSVTNSVASVPELAAQWHPTRNGQLQPEDVVAGTSRRLWWQCSKGPNHEWRATGNSRMSGRGCPFCAERGYNPSKPGALYILCGREWGKVGISNVLTQRLAKHAAGETFGSAVLTVQFGDGTLPPEVERSLLTFIVSRTSERSPRIDGFTESFPARMRDDVINELLRILKDVPEDEWSLVPERGP